MNIFRKISLLPICLLVAQTLSAQSLPLDNLKKLFDKGKVFKLNNGTNANTVYDDEHIFTGAGIELTPGNWKFAALYGRFLKAVNYEETHPEMAPTYKRMGYERIDPNYKTLGAYYFVNDIDRCHAKIVAGKSQFGCTIQRTSKASVSYQDVSAFV